MGSKYEYKSKLYSFSDSSNLDTKMNIEADRGWDAYSVCILRLNGYRVFYRRRKAFKYIGENEVSTG